MKRYNWILIILIFFVSCQNIIQDESSVVINEDSVIPKKQDSTYKKPDSIIFEDVKDVAYDQNDSAYNRNKIKFCRIMRMKNISLFTANKCKTARPIEINKYQPFKCYIDSSKISSNSISVDFKFIGECCEKFMGDYKIKYDTLIFELEQINSAACTCYCWYRYKLKINKLKLKVKQVIIRNKNCG